jgi:hypothetical protein
VNNGRLHSHGVLRFKSKDRYASESRAPLCCSRVSAALPAGRRGLLLPLSASRPAASSFRSTNHRSYEGQFENGRMDGYGVYVWSDGT